MNVPPPEFPVNSQTASDLLAENRIAEHFVAELARALHQSGLASDELEQNVSGLAEQLDLRVSVFATPTSIFFSFGEEDHYRTLLLRVTPGDINLGKLNDLQALQRDVVEERISLRDGRTQLPLILKQPPTFGPFITALAFGWCSAAATLLFGGGRREWILTLIVGVLVGAFAETLVRWPRLARVFIPISALAASLIPYLVGIWVQPLSVEIATLGSLIVLLPGLTLTIAINELATQNLAAGTARLFGAIVLLLNLSFGVALGSAIGMKFTSTPLNITPQPISASYWYVALLSAPFAFAILFRAKPSDFISIMISCLTGYAVSKQASVWLGPEVSGSMGALVVGIMGSLFARWTGRPSSTLVVPGLTFLVPGSIGFKSIQLLLNDNVESAVRGAFQMFLIAISLVAGLLVAYTLLPNHPNIKRRTGSKPFKF